MPPTEQERNGPAAPTEPFDPKQRRTPEVGTPGAVQSAYTGHLPEPDEVVQPPDVNLANTGNPGPTRAGVAPGVGASPAPDDPNRRMVTPQDDVANPNVGNTDPNVAGPQGTKPDLTRTQINPTDSDNAPRNAQGPAAAKSPQEAEADRKRTGEGANAPTPNTREGNPPGERR